MSVTTVEGQDTSPLVAQQRNHTSIGKHTGRLKQTSVKKHTKKSREKRIPRSKKPSGTPGEKGHQTKATRTPLYHLKHRPVPTRREDYIESYHLRKK
jgi:hypothetical protein